MGEISKTFELLAAIEATYRLDVPMYLQLRQIQRILKRSEA